MSIRDAQDAKTIKAIGEQVKEVLVNDKLDYLGKLFEIGDLVKLYLQGKFPEE